MNTPSVRRALVALAAVTTPLALAAPAQAAAVRPLVAGADTTVSAAPGGVFTAQLSVTNIDSVAVDGTGLWFGGLGDYQSATRYSNCTYDIHDNLQSCRLALTLEPGKTYRAELPLRVPADAYAPGSRKVSFDWMTGKNYDLVTGPAKPGTGEELRLTEDTAPGPRHVTSWQTVNLDVTGNQGADLVASGGKVYGAAGETVQLKPAVRNNGPASLDWISKGVSPGQAIVTIPPGTSVVTTPSLCKATSDAQKYACETTKLFTVGSTNSWPFNLRIDRVVPDATGTVEVNPACDCERFADDLDKSNDTASLVVNPAPTAPGNKDTNPPVVASTGLTEGQWIGRFHYVTPAWSDDVAVTKVQVLVNGTVTKTWTGTLPREFLVEPPSDVHNREARVTVRAFDAAGNHGDRTTTVRADVLSPTATITPAYGTRVTGTVPIRPTGVESDTVRIELREWGGKVVGRSTAAPWTMNWNTRGGANGDRWLEMRAVDRAGNVSFAMGEYYVDNAGPSVTAITPGNRALVRGSVRTTAKASDPSGIRSARVTGAKATSSPWAWTVTPKAQGNHTIEWVVTDKLGNTTIARRVVVNDTVAPALKLTKAPANNAKLTKSTTLTAAASDRNGIAKVQFLVNGKVVATDAKAAYQFTLNPKKYGKKFTVQVRAYDKAGNSKTLAKRTYRR
ncbi:Ig-like domain-containing protein [Actinoplanes sp. DH11]|uniref:Ig-like domain-containing protein n=1 Tax=Actinoplanes sp. DH11 TaxID=2857011 RepID=UPI001E5301DA|nr:Ig-like domain-containing protein [Actinoplanes sp. DH11]